MTIRTGYPTATIRPQSRFARDPEVLVLKNEPGQILGIATTAKEAIALGTALIRQNVDPHTFYVHCCPVGTISVHGHDYQGTRYSEWVLSPAGLSGAEPEPSRPNLCSEIPLPGAGTTTLDHVRTDDWHPEDSTKN